MAREVLGQFLGITQRFVGRNVELGNDMLMHDLRQRRDAIGCLPEDRGSRIETEQRRVEPRHDHHLVTNHAGSDFGCAGDIVWLVHYFSRERRVDIWSDDTSSSLSKS